MVDNRSARAGKHRWSLRQWVTGTIAAAIAVTLAAIAIGTYATVRLSDARTTVVSRVDPAVASYLALSDALLNQETGVRGYALTAQQDFLGPYVQGQRDQQAAVTALRRSIGDRYPEVSADLADVNAAAAAWQTGYAVPTVAEVRAAGRPLPPTTANAGKALFDHVRATLAALDRTVLDAQKSAHSQLSQSATLLNWTLGAIGVALLATAVALSIGLTRGVIRPLGNLAGHVKQVARGRFDHVVVADGPREIDALGLDVERMRMRILAELSALSRAHEARNAQTVDLQRSNAELEQFAYVASHDLQEPLRKVASFCELLAARYGDALDERGHQYIEYAVDGATRMQTLINDLLAFSRVGRAGASEITVDGNEILAAALADLNTRIEATGATVTADRLPPLRGDPTLLASVLQNLISNAIKFRDPAVPPRIAITVRRDGEQWLFACTDNGIGIDPEYAERIFAIFQRLHPRSEYPGTGIGLAMCRKIIEYHGGRIWLDTTRPRGEAGSRFCFTLPVAAADPTEPSHWALDSPGDPPEPQDRVLEPSDRVLDSSNQPTGDGRTS
ncbi:MAG TPA: ATP-binding protein [Micromonosporaceae bacterium]|jgi:signal transduction histidine kinase|nr:ATP-binding protein [Micromonosporaceae bacterium]